MAKPNNNKIPKVLVELSDMSLKKYKKKAKKRGEYFDSKKEMKKSYYQAITEMLDDGIFDLITKGYIQGMNEIKDKIYDVILDEDYIAYLTKKVKKDKYKNILKFFPALVYDVSQIVAEEVNNAKEAGKEEIKVVTEDLLELSKDLLEKKIKKLEKKASITDGVAFDILSVIPNTKILKANREFRFRNLYKVLYEHAKEKIIPFEPIMEILLEDEPDHVGNVILFSLLERKNKISGFTDTQMELFNAITKWCFEKLEEMPKRDISTILSEYVRVRKKDEAAGKDANRRYYISSLPETDYPGISAIVKKLIERNPSWENYF